MDEQKKYLGNAKQITTQYGPLMKVSFHKQDLEYMISIVNEKGYVNLNVNERKNPVEYATHSISVDTWRPQQQNQPQQIDAMPTQDDFVVPGEEMF